MEKAGAGGQTWKLAGSAAFTVLGIAAVAVAAFYEPALPPEIGVGFLAMIFAALGISAILTFRNPRPVASLVSTENGASNAIAGDLCRKLTAERDELFRDSAWKSQFLSEVVQDLRPRIGTILGFSEILASSAVSDMTESEVHNHHQILLDSSRSIATFVSEVHDMVRIETGTLHLQEQEVDSAELAEIAMKMCRDLAEAADVVILVDVFDGVELRCDAARIKQVLACLVSRSVNASQAGGYIRVSFARTLDNGLEVSVSDSGTGLAQPQIARIFEPDLPTSGLTGLALPIARRIAMLHGGNVTIESATGAGTTARLTLPPSRVSWTPGEDAGSTRAA